MCLFPALNVLSDFYYTHIVNIIYIYKESFQIIYLHTNLKGIVQQPSGADLPAESKPREYRFDVFLSIHHLLHLSTCCRHRTPDPINGKNEDNIFISGNYIMIIFLYTGPLLERTFADTK